MEALEVARQIKLDFNHDPIDVTIWNAAFAPGTYTLEALEQAVKSLILDLQLCKVMI